jgi:hypothetical protein
MENRQLTSYQQYERGTRLKRVVLLLVSSATLLLIASCGSSGNSVTGPNGNVTVNAPSKLTHRAFISNQFSGNLQIVDSQTDTTAYYTATNNNTGNTTPGGAPASAVAIQLGGSSTLMALRPDDVETVIFQPNTNLLNFVTNASETSSGTVTLPGSTSSLVYSPDSTKLYVPVPNAPVQNPGTPVTFGRPGAVQIIAEASSSAAVAITNSVPVPSAQSVAITPDGKTLLVFAGNSDIMYLIDLTATNPAAVAITGFARPVNAFFSTDSSTAYVLNCGPECGSTAGSPSVMRFNISSRTVTATVPVGGATVGLLKNTILYVAGYPGGSTGTLDVVDVSAMTRTTANPVAIGDGPHTTMAISTNNKLYIGAASCANQSVGCLSIVDIGKTALDTISQPLGAVTGMQAIPSRNTMYVVEGGVLYMYDTTTGQLQSTQIAFQGALWDVIQVDP